MAYIRFIIQLKYDALHDYHLHGVHRIKRNIGRTLIWRIEKNQSAQTWPFFSQYKMVVSHGLHCKIVKYSHIASSIRIALYNYTVKQV